MYASGFKSPKNKTGTRRERGRDDTNVRNVTVTQTNRGKKSESARGKLSEQNGHRGIRDTDGEYLTCHNEPESGGSSRRCRDGNDVVFIRPE